MNILILAVLVVYLSVRLSYYVDCLDKKTNLSGAFIGGVMLAAVTSLPELFTSLTAVLALDQPDLVQWKGSWQQYFQFVCYRWLDVIYSQTL